MAQSYSYPTSSSISLAAQGTNGVAIPTQSLLVSGKNNAGNLTPLNLDASGNLLVSLAADVVTAIPTTDAADGPVSPGAVASKSILIGAQYSLALPTLADGQQAAIQVDSSGRLMISSLPAGSATIGAVTLAAMTANSSAAATSSILIGVTDGTNQQPLIAPIVLGDGVNGNNSLAQVPYLYNGTSFDRARGDSTNGTWVNVKASALPSGASTSALQTTGNTSLSSIDGKIPSQGQALMAASLPVALASDQSAIPVSQSGSWSLVNISGTISLPTGAATSANQSAGNASLSSLDTKTPSQGQALMAASVPVTIASDQSAININNISGAVSLPTGAATAANQNTGNGSLSSIDTKTPALVSGRVPVDGSGVTQPVNQLGRAKANAPVLNDYSSTPITSSAYVQLIASTSSDVNEIEIFDSSGQTLYLAVGAASSEVNQIIITPGGNGRVALAIPAGSRVSAKATSTSATSGILVINLYT